MVLFNYSTKELTAKVVYYGPGLCGKTTNLQWIHEKLPIKNKGKMLSLATEADRTLFFDFLPIELGTIRGMKTRIQLYTVPGQVFYNATRRMVLKGADCVVFVADSQEPMLDANLDALVNLRENLEVNEIDPDELPMVMQYNKRDLPNALPVEILNERLNPKNLPFYEAVAMKGQGVEETLKGVTGVVFRSLAGKYGGAETTAAPAVAPAAPTPAPVPAPAPPPPIPQAALRPAAPPRPPVVPAAPFAPAPVANGPVVTDETPAVSGDDELLESIDLSLAAPPEEESLDLAFDEEEPAPTEEMETLNVEDLTPVPGPPVPVVPAFEPPPHRPGRAEAAKATLVRGADEADDLRRRLRRPAQPEVTLDELEEEEDIEAISLQPPPAARPVGDAPTSPRLSTAEAARRTSPPPPPPVPPPPVAVAPAPVPPPPPSFVSPPSQAGAVRTIGAATLPPPPTMASVVVPVDVPAGATPSEIVVPIDVTIGPGGAQVHLNLRITLNVKLG